MKKLIPLLILILIVSLFAACSDDAPEPNADFGMVARSYLPSPYDELPIEDCTGDTDVVYIDAWYPNQSDDVYRNYIERWGEKDNPNYDALTLHLRLNIAKGYTVELMSVSVDGTETECSADLDPRLREHIIPVAFPLHRPGAHSITYNFRNADDGSLYTITHTLTIPEPSGSKFDLLSPDIEVLYHREDIEHNGATILNYGDSYAATLRIAAVCRSNDGTMPYQDLLATRLEKSVDGRWVDAPPRPGGYSAVTALTDDEAENSFISPAGYYVDDPITGEAVTNVFCGTAGVYLDDAGAMYRLTMEFCENPDGSGERWVLTFNIAAAPLS